MYKYTPFLKLKVSEIGALKEIKESKKNGFIPFFDFPRKKPKKVVIMRMLRVTKMNCSLMIW